jgi:hypothetical protein
MSVERSVWNSRQLGKSRARGSCRVRDHEPRHSESPQLWPRVRYRRTPDSDCSRSRASTLLYRRHIFAWSGQSTSWLRIWLRRPCTRLGSTARAYRATLRKRAGDRKSSPRLPFATSPKHRRHLPSFQRAGIAIQRGRPHRTERASTRGNQTAVLGRQRRLRRLNELFEKFLLRHRVHKLQCRDTVLRLDEPPAEPGEDADVRRQRGGRPSIG